MPPWVVCMADHHIRHKTGQLVNHAIITKYDSGTKTHAPPHMDKAPKDPSFFVFSYGKPRRFDVLDTKIVESEDEKKRDASGNPVKKYNKDGTVKTKMVPSTVCWSKELEHNSLLVIADSKTNDSYNHAISERQGVGGRDMVPYLPYHRVELGLNNKQLHVLRTMLSKKNHISNARPNGKALNFQERDQIDIFKKNSL
jgi:hypothetical protein